MSSYKCRLTAKFVASIGCVGFMLAVAVQADARPYQLSAKAKNRVEFHSKATLESFSGKAKSISAEFEIDPAKITSARGKVIVDLRTLDTGIGLRNKHMCENHLQTDSFPNAVFILDSLVKYSVPFSGADAVTVHGVMTIHGVSRAVSARGVVSSLFDTDKRLRIESEFPLKITDFGIPRPEFLFLKLAEEVKIVVDLTLEPVAE